MADHLAEGAGIESYSLMRRAGKALAEVVLAAPNAGVIQVLCGPGANGGDGYVAAKMLHEAGREVSVYSFGDVAHLNGDAARAHLDWHGGARPAMPDIINGDGILIDALFGAGLSRPLVGEGAALVQAINASGAYVISADLPSGIFGDEGAVSEVHVRAHETVTFFRKKPAHVLQPSREFCGKITLADIGIPDHVLGEIQPQCFENNPKLWPDLPPLPSVMAHKYSRGHVLVRCGGALQTGAARLAAHAALRAGAGLVTLLADMDAARVCAVHETEVMITSREAKNTLETMLTDRRVSAAVIGPAGGVDAAMRKDVLTIRKDKCPMVLDADGISAFADTPDHLFAVLDETCVLTPHEGEFARLFPDLADRSHSKIARTQAAAKRAGCVIVLKGPDSVIAVPDGRAIINTNAPLWLATAGSGDVLAGIIGALLGQGGAGFEAAACGVWLHGAAGSTCGRGLIAGDLSEALPTVLQTRL
ncbi:MAG: bifunctional ADP-dependent NAD(P)H-hydrate dehydratase/NAD(P)H-hydrate epimerase [Robiginitomaculum sp.]|nr:MAG: bifunctional ADP-dependent NAD(P)H-hydrate dehydratase/NAD(P)H-hydrate epimerase [Robiginitomaculum sp.]